MLPGYITYKKSESKRKQSKLGLFSLLYINYLGVICHETYQVEPH